MKSALLALVPPAVVALAVVVAYILDDNPDVPEPEEESETVGYTGTVLLTDNRERLEICVDVLDAPFSEVPPAISAIEEAWPEVAAHPVWERKYSQFGPPGLHRGCPGEPSIVDGPIAGSSPSKYRIWVFVVDPETTSGQRECGGRIRCRAAQEDLHYEGSHEYAEVSTGIYLAPGDLESTCVVARMLVDALGLERDPPEAADCPTT